MVAASSPAGEGREGLLQAGMGAERLRPRDRDRVVRREVAPIVLEHREAVGRDEPIRRAAHDEVHLLRQERRVEEAQVHLARGPGEGESVGGE